jgi:hypothetical protein
MASLGSYFLYRPLRIIAMSSLPMRLALRISSAFFGEVLPLPKKIIRSASLIRIYRVKPFHQKVEELALGIGDLLFEGSEIHNGHSISLISGLMVERFDLVELEGESLAINELRIVGFVFGVSIGA